MTNNLNNELKAIESDFNTNISNLALESVKNNETMKIENLDLFSKQIHKDIQVDVEVLSAKTSELLSKNDKISDDEIAIELLKKIVSTSDSKFMRKLASEMIREEWWNK